MIRPVVEKSTKELFISNGQDFTRMEPFISEKEPCRLNNRKQCSRLIGSLPYLIGAVDKMRYMLPHRSYFSGCVLSFTFLSLDWHFQAFGSSFGPKTVCKVEPVNVWLMDNPISLGPASQLILETKFRSSAPRFAISWIFQGNRQIMSNWAGWIASLHMLQ